jgi:hypothetical protein
MTLAGLLVGLAECLCSGVDARKVLSALADDRSCLDGSREPLAACRTQLGWARAGMQSPDTPARSVDVSGLEPVLVPPPAELTAYPPGRFRRIEGQSSPCGAS